MNIKLILVILFIYVIIRFFQIIYCINGKNYCRIRQLLEVDIMRKITFALTIIFGIYYVFFFDTIHPDWKMVFKLIPMILIILFALLATSKHHIYSILVCIGLVFCAIGDYTLQWFIVGLTFFLMGHLFYIAAFTRKKANVPMSAKALLIVYGLIMGIWMASTLFNRGETVLSIAVIAYVIVILTMGWTSFRTGNKFAIIGAFFFIASDTILAINRFIVDLPAAHELVMFTYYTAQILIALSIEKSSTE